MKKIFSIIFLIFPVIFSCTNPKLIKSESCKITSRHGAIIEEWFLLYDNNGREIKNKRYRLDDHYYWDRSTGYNSDGTISEIIDYQKDGTVYQTVKLEYDGGRCFKDSTYDNKNKLIRYSVYKWPTALSEICFNYNSQGELLGRQESIFNSGGRVLKISFFNSKGYLYGEKDFSYEKDFSHPVTIINRYKQKSEKQQYLLNASGNVIRELRYVNNKILSEIIYEYDFNNNLITYKGFKSGIMDGSKHFTYRDDNVNLVESFTLRDHDDKILEAAEFKYEFYN
ncbi:MAG: hypothetical protein CVV49_18400 [Spirochaetae bacterium HGW-Spirochaetae-5]|nr:MAG: hypothetical protein CVV49_18400 [Spirochaetae bacterium HGW-Spirochaetae-5]